MESRTTGDDLWINISETCLGQGGRSVYYGCQLHDPFPLCNTKRLAPAQARESSKCSCPKEMTPDIPRSGLFDEHYVELEKESPETIHRRCWGIKRSLEPPVDGSEKPPKRKAKHHWGRDIIESEQIYSYTGCVIG